MNTQLKAGDKAILIPYEQGPFCPAVILEATEGQDGRKTYRGAYFNGSTMQVFGVSEGTAGIQLFAESPMLEPLIAEQRDRIEQEIANYELGFKRYTKLKSDFAKYFG